VSVAAKRRRLPAGPSGRIARKKAINTIGGKMIETRMLAFVDVKDRDSWQDWSRQHMEWHTRIYTEAVKQGFRRYDIFPQIRDMADVEGWAYFHSVEHQNIAESVGTSIVDLSGFDASDEDVIASWLSVHAQIHTDIRTVLAIT